jgi:hypothetical protein
VTKIGSKPLVSWSADRRLGSLQQIWCTRPCSKPCESKSKLDNSYTVLDKMFRSQVKLQTKLGLQVVQFDSFQFNVFLLKAEPLHSNYLRLRSCTLFQDVSGHMEVSEFFGRCLDMNGKRSRLTTMWRFQARHLGMVLVWKYWNPKWAYQCDQIRGRPLNLGCAKLGCPKCAHVSFFFADEKPRIA